LIVELPKVKQGEFRLKRRRDGGALPPPLAGNGWGGAPS
jgi:hypothetical protein